MATEDVALRQAIITRLKGDTGIAAIVGDRIYEEPPANPVWPFIRYGVDISIAFRGDGIRGEDKTVTIHAFVNGPGQNVASSLARLIRLSLDEVDFELDSAGGVLLLQWEQAQILTADSANASAYHAVVEFRAVIAEITE